jgi:hypothetical protein
VDKYLCDLGRIETLSTLLRGWLLSIPKILARSASEGIQPHPARTLHAPGRAPARCTAYYHRRPTAKHRHRRITKYALQAVRGRHRANLPSFIIHMHSLSFIRIFYFTHLFGLLSPPSVAASGRRAPLALRPRRSVKAFKAFKIWLEKRFARFT